MYASRVHVRHEAVYVREPETRVFHRIADGNARQLKLGLGGAASLVVVRLAHTGDGGSTLHRNSSFATPRSIHAAPGDLGRRARHRLRWTSSRGTRSPLAAAAPTRAAHRSVPAPRRRGAERSGAPPGPRARPWRLARAGPSKRGQDLHGSAHDLRARPGRQEGRRNRRQPKVINNLLKAVIEAAEDRYAGECSWRSFARTSKAY